MKLYMVRDVTILVGLAALCVSGFIWMVAAQDTVPASVELTKDEAVQLLQLQFQLESVLRVRDELVADLYVKHGISRDQYDLNIFAGRFTLTSPKEVKEK